MDSSDHGSLVDQFKLIPLLLLLLLLLSSLVGVDMANSPSPSYPMSNSMFGPFSSQLVTQSANTSDLSAFLPLLNSTDLRFTFGWAPIPTNANNNQMNAPTGPTPTLYLLSIIYLPYLAPQQVWTANRDRPVSRGATLTLSSTGTLLLTDSDLSHVWSSSSSSTNTRHDDLLTLSLLDHGNLMVAAADSSSPDGIVWQSFDHPTDTILPGQVISTGTRIVSSVSYGKASSGPYSVVVERAGLIMYVRISSDTDTDMDTDTVTGPPLLLPYHVVGFSAVNENNTIESVAHPSSCKSTTIHYASGGGVLEFTQGSPSRAGMACDGNTFEIPVASNSDRGHNAEDIFLRLDPDGNVRTYVYRLKYGWEIDQEIFSPTLYCHLPSRCGTYGVCTSHGSCACPLVNTAQPDEDDVSGQLFRANNPSDPSQGCTLSQPPICPRNTSTTTNDDDANYFVELVGASYFANHYVHQGTTPSLDQCKSMCASSCNCTIAFYQENTGNCYNYGYAMSIQYVPDPSFRTFIKVGRNATLGMSSPSPRSNPMLSSITIVLIVVSSVLMCVLVASVMLLGAKIWRRLGARHEEEDDDAFLESLRGLPTRFTFKELYKATGGFRRQIGSGGFGAVYEGKLPDGTMVAVKRLDSAKQGHKEFHAEIATLGSINHINLVRLRGFCTQRSQCLLVYDHMAHGSLDQWLFSDSKVLDWPIRRSIALDTARGLAFLHEESRECIVHLDIKPQNILLDLSFIAKLSDFGLSKLMNREETDIVTNVRGTPGYVAPEWLLQVGVTSKSDVYSYGMVLLELISGRRNLDLSRNAFWYFPAWAVIMVEDNKMLEIVDKRLKPKTMTDETVKEVERLIKVAMWCIQEDPLRRPCMSGVVRMLEGNGEVENAPSLLDFAMRTRSSMKPMNSTSSSNTLTSKSFKSDASASTHLSNSVLSAPR